MLKVSIFFQFVGFGKYDCRFYFENYGKDTCFEAKLREILLLLVFPPKNRAIVFVVRCTLSVYCILASTVVVPIKHTSCLSRIFFSLIYNLII